VSWLVGLPIGFGLYLLFNREAVFLAARVKAQ
jgi:hypothetical protein